MHRQRIFIAINLPEDVKKKLTSYESQWPDLPARWTREENIHITLVFIGEVGAEAVGATSAAARAVAAEHAPFEIRLTKLCYGPIGKPQPRMVWVVGERSGACSALKNDLEESLAATEKIPFRSENRGFTPHITLARIRQWDWRKIEPEERPLIKEDLDITIPVDSIELMESELRRGGPRYSILESYNLGHDA